jgi:hypothetical protein
VTRRKKSLEDAQDEFPVEGVFFFFFFLLIILDRSAWDRLMTQVQFRLELKSGWIGEGGKRETLSTSPLLLEKHKVIHLRD